MTEQQIVDRLKELLIIKSWTPYRLSKESGVPTSSINNIFQLKCYPTIPTLTRICKAFDITLSEFFAFEEVPLREANLDLEDQKMINRYNSLSAKKKELFKTYLDGLSVNKR